MIQTIISSGILVLLVLAARHRRRRLGSDFIHYLWVVPFLRFLVLPLIRVPKRWSMFYWLQRFLHKIAPLFLTGDRLPRLNAIINPYRASAVRIAVIVWLIGMVSVFLYHIIPYVSLKLKLQRNRSFVKRLSDSGLDIYYSDIIKTPFIDGFKIYLPETLRGNEQYCEMAICHEVSHYYQLDGVFNLARVIISCVYWFDPFAWIAVYYSKADSEFSCDEAVTKGMEQELKERYCQFILEISTGIGLSHKTPLIDSALATSFVVERTENVLSIKIISTAMRFFEVIFLLAVMAMTLSTW